MTYDPLREANPVPYEDSLPTDAWSVSVLLATIDERHALMDTKELVQAPEPETRKAWPVALMAAAAVLAVVVGTFFVFGGGSGDEPPADQPKPVPTTVAEASEPDPAPVESTTTTVLNSNELSAAELEYVGAFVAAFNGRNQADLASFLSASIRVEDGVIWEGGLAEFEESLPWRYAMNEEWELISCQRLSAFSCIINYANDAIDHVFGPMRGGMRLEVNDGEIVDLTFTLNDGMIAATVGPFYEWVAERYPDDLSKIKGAGTPGQPLHDEEATQLWVTLLDEYMTEMGYNA